MAQNANRKESLMHARVTTVTGASDVDRGSALLRDQVVPQLQQQRGFRGLSAAGDRSAGVFTALSLWDSSVDLQASERAADLTHAGMVRLMGGQVTVERYEESVCEASDTRPGSQARLHIRHITVDPNRVDDMLDFFRQRVLPEIKTRPGFLALRQLIDRNTGVGRVGSVWMDQASLSASLAQSERRRMTAMDRGVKLGEGQVLEILYTAP
jgi:hypothetical protein